MAIENGRVKILFQGAIERDDPAERRAFLDQEIGDDPELRDRLTDLLVVYDRPTGMLDRPLFAGLISTGDFVSPQGGRAEDESEAILGTVIAGRYKVRQKIGEGGMGGVYLAEQSNPVRRQVALKLIKPGMDSKMVLARFESERQALAMMDHPNIAKVLDAGSTEAGRPFFVMDLVKGIPLTDYCDLNRLDLTERLGLFRQICSAVHHAHQKGIIHRDLKPTNILVENHDGTAVPRVIDFGLAKATTGMQLSAHSLFTAFGSVTGTPLYMAPEQASFNALDVDTRADIYTLGVILYELLTGSTPIQRDTLQRAALDEMFRVIREDEPPTPSSRISTSEGIQSLAVNRHVDQSRLSRQVKGDLDWIVMKALAKERSRRYDSAIELGADVERFLIHEPVTAGPPTAVYRFTKFVRRHRSQVVAMAMVLLALVGGVAGTTLGLFEARRQREVALSEGVEKDKAQSAEAEQRRLAEERLGQVAKMNIILCSIFQDLEPDRAEKEGRLTAELLERVDTAAAQMEREVPGDPIVAARMEMTLGKAQRNLGYAKKSIALLTKAYDTYSKRFGPDHPDTLKSLLNLALGYSDAGQVDRALKIFEESRTQVRTKLGSNYPDTFRLLLSLARNLQTSGRHDLAEPLWSDLITLGESAGKTEQVKAWKAERMTLNAARVVPKSEAEQR